MNRVLITGCNGFVARYLIKELKDSNKHFILYGCDKDRNVNDGLEIEYYKCNISKKEDVNKIIRSTEPDFIYHLAAVSNPIKAEQDPLLTYEVNLFGTLNILEYSRLLNKQVKILIIGSSECYGQITSRDRVHENHSCSPVNHYGISKYLSEKIALKYNNYENLDIFCTRSFNHSGPGQREGFVLIDFTKQIADIELGRKEPKLFVGNLEVVRDFLDVRDVVRAYVTIMYKGTYGGVYNVCSGEGVFLSNILNYLIGLIGRKDVKILKSKQKIRSIDNPYVVGDNSKLKSLGWDKKWKIEDTLKDVYKYWRKKLQNS